MVCLIAVLLGFYFNCFRLGACLSPPSITLFSFSDGLRGVVDREEEPAASKVLVEWSSMS
jgi:hypothetical protein